jgi:hypothetical protein
MEAEILLVAMETRWFKDSFDGDQRVISFLVAAQPEHDIRELIFPVTQVIIPCSMLPKNWDCTVGTRVDSVP